jgi:hypothetical protein
MEHYNEQKPPEIPTEPPVTETMNQAPGGHLRKCMYITASDLGIRIVTHNVRGIGFTPEIVPEDRDPLVVSLPASDNSGPQRQPSEMG